MRRRREHPDKTDKREPREKKKKRSGNRRARGAIVAVIFAAVGAVGLVTFVRGAEERALAGERLVNVLVVRDTVPAGTRATEMADKVKVEAVPAKVRSEGAVSDIDAVSGLVAAVELLPGEQVTAARFVPADEFIGRSTAVNVPDDLHEVTISLDPQRAVGGVLRPGSTVGVVASFDSFDASGGLAAEEGEAPRATRTPNSTGMILHKVLVTNVQRTRAFDTRVGDDENQSATAPDGNLLVTLALDAPSVERVVFAAEHGRLWLSLEPSGAPEDGTRVQTRGSVYE